MGDYTSLIGLVFGILGAMLLVIEVQLAHVQEKKDMVLPIMLGNINERWNDILAETPDIFKEVTENTSVEAKRLMLKDWGERMKKRVRLRRYGFGFLLAGFILQALGLWVGSS